MFYHDRSHASEDIDVNETSTSKEYITYCYWYFLNKRSMFQSSVCNGCHDVLIMFIEFSSTAILSMHRLWLVVANNNKDINLLKMLK